MCIRMCQNEEPIKFFNPAAFTDASASQFIGTSSATDTPPNFFYGDTSASLLWQCLDATRDDPVNGAAELATCCAMDAACQSSMTAAMGCYTTNCVDQNLKVYTKDYFTCVSTGGCASATTGSDFGAFCFQQILGSPNINTGLATDPSSSTLADIQDQYVGLLAGLDQANPGCGFVEPLINATCGASNQCCPNCNVAMGKVLDVLINGVILEPTLTNDFAVNYSCPVDQDRCCPGGLCPDTTAAARNSGSGGGRGLLLRQLDESSDAVVVDADVVDGITDKCTNGLTRDFFAYNQTYAAGKYMGCLQLEMARLVLEQEVESNSAGGAPTMAPSGAARLAVTLGAALVGVGTMLL